MGNENCYMCGKKFGYFSFKCGDGYGHYICRKCSDYLFHPLEHSFSTTKIYNKYISIDEKSKLFTINKHVYEYSSLLSYELLEDGASVTKGGLGRAVVGGVLFGGVGAIVGGVTGKKRSRNICDSMKIRVSLKNASKDVEYITIVSYPIKTNSYEYGEAQKLAQECITALDYISNFNQYQKSSYVQPRSISAPDEIMKYKTLLDNEVITQEEFDTKKKQLLGL